MLINAHRGDSIRYRENTMPAFASAVGLGVDYIELDVHASQDNQPTVLHDETLERLWGVRKPVSSLNYDQIFRMTNSSDFYVPRLEEILSTFDVPIMIDFVGKSAVQPIIRAVNEYRAAERCIVSSGNIFALFAIRRNMKNISIALTWNDIIPPSDNLLKKLDVQYFNPNYRLYQDAFVAEISSLHQTSDQYRTMIQEAMRRRAKYPDWYATEGMCGSHFVSHIHRSERKVSAWTVDHPAVMVEMMKLGVDLVTTNDIRTLMEVRNGAYSS